LAEVVETRRRTLAKKQALVDGIREKLEASQAVILVDYCGLTAEQMSNLRRRLKEKDSELRVVKNTLALRASESTALAQALDLFKGPTAFVFGYKDPVETAKVLVKFSKEAEQLRLKGGLIEGKVYGAEGVDAMSRLPSREVLLATLLANFNAPIAGFVNVLAANLRGLVTVLNAIKDKREKEA